MNRALPLFGGGLLELSRPLVMGILNATPDSFSDGGEIDDPETRAERVAGMIAAGVDLIDIGGESTRPGHSPVAAEDEIRRVLPVIAAVRNASSKIPISVDTRKSSVATAALDTGANLVNDVSSLADPAMGDVVAGAGCGYVAMRSAPCTDPIVDSCREQLDQLVGRARTAGIGDDQVIVDPGLGFGKRPDGSVEDNLALLDGIAGYSRGRPVLIGASRKRFVRSLAGDDPRAVVDKSVALALRAVRAGAAIVRVHDVAETITALDREGLRPSAL